MIRPHLPQRVDIERHDAVEIGRSDAGLDAASIVRREVGDAVNDDTSLGVELDAQIGSRVHTVGLLLCENWTGQ